VAACIRATVSSASIAFSMLSFPMARKVQAFGAGGGGRVLPAQS
jgi:hypothetical protein